MNNTETSKAETDAQRYARMDPDALAGEILAGRWGSGAGPATALWELMGPAAMHIVARAAWELPGAPLDAEDRRNLATVLEHLRDIAPAKGSGRTAYLAQLGLRSAIQVALDVAARQIRDEARKEAEEAEAAD